MELQLDTFVIVASSVSTFFLTLKKNYYGLIPIEIRVNDPEMFF